MKTHRTTPLRAPSSRRAAHGFTLIELSAVVAVLIVMLGSVAPSFVDFLAGQQAKGLSYDLTADLMLARNEALKRNAQVSVSRLHSSWHEGWAVRVVDASGSPGEGLSQRNASAQTVTVEGAPASITFDVNGRIASPSASVRITISTRDSSRCVEVDLSGRARALAGACS